MKVRRPRSALIVRLQPTATEALTTMKLRYLIGTFVVFSVADLLLTRQLLAQEGRHFLEMNPLAAQLLESHGWPGLVWLKFGTTAMVASLFILLAPWRPRMVLGALGL